MIFLRYINHIKSYFFTKLNENNFYMKIIDLADLQLSSFEFFHLKPLRCSKKLMIFKLKGIFNFSHLQVDTDRGQSDGSDM